MRASMAMLLVVVSCANTPPAEPPVIELPRVASSAPTVAIVGAVATAAPSASASDEARPAPPAMGRRISCSTSTWATAW